METEEFGGQRDRGRFATQNAPLRCRKSGVIQAGIQELKKTLPHLRVTQ